MFCQFLTVIHEVIQLTNFQGDQVIPGCLEMPEKDFCVSVLPYDLLHFN